MKKNTRSEILESSLVLVLSTGFEPMFRTSWKRAVSAIVCGRAEIVEKLEGFSIRTGSGEFPFPTKVRFTTGVFIGKIKKFRGKPKLSKKNLWLRDGGLCQYCSKKIALSNCTIDHVVPKSRGGDHTWENVALSCSSCNQKKGSKLLSECSMNLNKIPDTPETVDIKIDTHDNLCNKVRLNQ